MQLKTSYSMLGNLRDNENFPLRGLLMIQRRYLFIISSPSFSDCQSRLSIKYTATPPMLSQLGDIPDLGRRASCSASVSVLVVNSFSLLEWLRYAPPRSMNSNIKRNTYRTSWHLFYCTIKYHKNKITVSRRLTTSDLTSYASVWHHHMPLSGFTWRT